MKNGGVLERLARCTTVLLDKTGTLTAGQPAVTAVVPARQHWRRKRSWASRLRWTRPPGTSWRPRSSARRPSAAARSVQPADVTGAARPGHRGNGRGPPGQARARRMGRGDGHSAVGQGRPQAGLAGRRAHRVRRRRRHARGRAPARGPDPAGRPADDQGAAPRRHHPDRARDRRPGRGGQRRRRADRSRRGARRS